MNLSTTIETKIKANENFREFVKDCQKRFLRNDWGDMFTDEKKENEEAEKWGLPIIGVYIFDSKNDVVIEKLNNRIDVNFRRDTKY